MSPSKMNKELQAALIAVGAVVLNLILIMVIFRGIVPAILTADIYGALLMATAAGLAGLALVIYIFFAMLTTVHSIRFPKQKRKAT